MGTDYRKFHQAFLIRWRNARFCKLIKNTRVCKQTLYTYGETLVIHFIFASHYQILINYKKITYLKERPRKSRERVLQHKPISTHPIL